MGVKIWVEQMAAGLGYDRVVWDELPAADGADQPRYPPRS